MRKSVLIIDDVKEQAQGLSKALSSKIKDVQFDCLYEEQSILPYIENRFFSLAIVDIRMDDFRYDGLDLVRTIFELNPFAKVIIVSAFKDEYFLKMKDLLLSGRVIDILDKEDYDIWIPKIAGLINDYFSKLDESNSEVSNALLQFYADTLNEKDTYRKGEKFEHFISLMFQSMGFKEVLKRVKDKSLNEVDLIIRNDTDDTFLNKFGKYILIECKNKPDNKVDKNDFIVFYSKLKNTNGLAELGILVTSNIITRNTYIEAVRSSTGQQKVIFISNNEIKRLIFSNDRLNEFKSIIDEQLKDN